MRQAPKKHALIIIGVLVMMLSAASAQQGTQVALGGYPTSGVINASVAVPMFKTQDVQHVAKAGVSYAFIGAPALSVTYVLSDANPGPYYTYIGAGVGLAFPGAPAVSPSLSGHALAGVNIHISNNFGAFTEVTVAGNSFGTRMSFGVGVAYMFGGVK